MAFQTFAYILAGLICAAASAQQTDLRDGLLRTTADESDCPSKHENPCDFLRNFVKTANWEIQTDVDGKPISYLDANGEKTYDPRGSLSVMGPQIGMTPEQQYKAMTSTGQITCLGTKDGNGGYGNGSLFINNGLLITVSHMLFDEEGRSRGPCSFRNWDPNGHPIDLDLAPASVIAETYTPYAKDQSSYDIVVVRLAEKIQLKGSDGKLYDAEAFQPVPAGTAQVTKNDRMIAISAIQLPMQDHDQGSEPIVQSCTPGIDPTYAPSGRVAVFYGDCSGTDGSSGSLEVQVIDGQMYARGLLARTANPSYDGQPYQGPGDNKSHTYSIGIESKIIAGAQQLEGRKE